MSKPIANKAKQILQTSSALRNEDIEKMLNKKLLRTQEGVKIMLVDGDVVRKYYYSEFYHGVNDKIKHLIPVPDGEIWIERGLSPKRTENVIVHELSERKVMGSGDKKLPYETAHNKVAVPIEEKFRSLTRKSKRISKEKRLEATRKSLEGVEVV